MTICTDVHIIKEWSSNGTAAKLTRTSRNTLDFADAATVLFDDMAITVKDDSVDEEERYVALGMDALGRCLVVVYTWREEIVRLISARPATRSERRPYEGEI